MTLRHTSEIVACFWLTTAFWQIVVALVAIRPSIRRTYPAFTSFASFAGVSTPVLMVLPPERYFVGYAVVAVATVFLIGAVLFELYVRVCGPHLSLPAWVPKTMASWLLVAIGASTVATYGLYNVGSLPKRAALLTAGQGGMLMALFLALTVLVTYSTYLRMKWKTRPKQIVIGLAIYLSVNTLVLFLENHVPREFIAFLDRASQITVLVSLIWWTFALRRREPAPEPVTQEMMDTILAFHRETVETAKSVGLV